MQIAVTGCEVGIILFIKTMPVIKLYPVQVFLSNNIRIVGGVTYEDIIGVSGIGFFIQSGQDGFEILP